MAKTNKKRISPKTNAPKPLPIEGLLRDMVPPLDHFLDSKLSESELRISSRLQEFHSFLRGSRTSPKEYLMGGFEADNKVFDVYLKIPGPSNSISINVYKHRKGDGYGPRVFTLTHENGGSTKLKEGRDGQAYGLDRVFSTTERKTKGVSLYECLQDVCLLGGEPKVVYNFMVELPGIVDHYIRKVTLALDGLTNQAKGIKGN